MKKVVTLIAASFALAGCSTSEPTRSREASPIAVAAMVTGGAVVGAVATPVAIALGIPQRAKEEAEAKRQLLDPIYRERIVSITTLDAVSDAARRFESGQFIFLPSIPDGKFYPGLERESWSPEHFGLPTKESNLAAIHGDAQLIEVMRLTANCPQHKDLEKPPLYISDIYFAFQRAAWSYKATFNQSMFRQLQGKTLTQVPEPAPTAVTSPSARGLRQP